MLTRTIVKLLTISSILAVVMLASCAQTERAKDGSELLSPIPAYGAAPLIRVKLAKPSDMSAVTIKSDKATLTLDGRRMDVAGEIKLTLTEGAVDAGGYGRATSIEIAPLGRPAFFDVEGRIYRGKLRVIAKEGAWDVVNVIDLEQYVAGVIGWEMIASWPVEALKAQAVASRTYALFEMERRRASGDNWDLDDTTQFQVYGGVGPADNPKHWRETANVLEARQATSGMVLTYNGKGFRAYFHSTSGGATTDPATALLVDDVIEPLKGVDLGDFDKDSPKASWEIRLPGGEVKARMIERGVVPSDVIRMEVAEAGESGHAITVKLYDRTGHHRLVSAVAIRQALGLYSTRFTAEKNGDEWVFAGKGYGHGCGMCQWSARGMAKAGWESDRILKTMYPGSELKSLY
ncbi:MAG: SpoIID/LytB domain-containing protein [Planctomycetes bacterium]|nr:SpoIID/LytB domain-containing protein [Planctomycetota bacterium]